MEQPLISAIIPCWNAARFLAVTLESIQAQSEVRWECILVDDGSTDNSLEIAQKFAAQDQRFRCIRQTNGGPGAARNHGLRLAHPQAEFVAFMDADDVWLPHSLEFLLKALQNEPEAVAVSGVAEYIDAEGRVIDAGHRRLDMLRRIGLRGNRLYELEAHQPTTFDVLFLGTTLYPPGALLCRKALVERIGGFDVALNGPDDWDILVRLSRHGYIRLLDELVIYYRIHAGNHSASSFMMKRLRAVMVKTYHSPENTPEQQQIVRTAWRLLQRKQRRARLNQFRSALRQRKMKEAARHWASMLVTVPREVVGPERPGKRVLPRK